MGPNHSEWAPLIVVKHGPEAPCYASVKPSVVKLCDLQSVLRKGPRWLEC